MIIGITGGSGSGKTTLLKELEARGALVLDCDAIYYRLLKTDASLLSAIEVRFPGTVVDGELQRKKLGSIVFSDENALRDLNKITHAAIHTEVLRQLKTAGSLVAIDAIALFESGLARLCDVTVAVVAPVDVRIQRLVERDCISEEYARSRIDAQHEDSWFRENCGYVLENNGEKADFQVKCLAFLQELGIMNA